MRGPFYFALLLLFALALSVGVEAYYDFRFTADGYHYFSAINNFVRGFGFYEGPTFEHIFGNHTYLFFILLAPFVALFKSPVVLLVVSILAHFTAAIVLFEWSRHYLKSEGWAVLFASFYFLHPFNFFWLFSESYILQPDMLFPVCIFGMAWAYHSSRYTLLAVVAVLAVSIKEEYVLSVPAVLVFLYMLWPKQIEKRDLLKVFGAVFSISVLSLGLLFYYKSLNHHTHIKPNFAIELLLDDSIREQLYKVFFCMMGPLFLLAVVGYKGAKSKIFLYKTVIITSFLIFFRLVGQVILYARVDFYRWSHSIMPPLLFISLVALVHNTPAMVWRKRSAHALVFSMLCMLEITVNTHPFLLYEVMQSKSIEIETELTMLASRLPEPVGIEAIAMPGFYNQPFYARSLVPIWYMDECMKSREESCWAKFDYVMLTKTGNTGSEKYMGQLPPSMELIYESAALLLYRYKGGVRAPASNGH